MCRGERQLDVVVELGVDAGLAVEPDEVVAVEELLESLELDDDSLLVDADVDEADSDFREP